MGAQVCIWCLSVSLFTSFFETSLKLGTWWLPSQKAVGTIFPAPFLSLSKIVKWIHTSSLWFFFPSSCIIQVSICLKHFHLFLCFSAFYFIFLYFFIFDFEAGPAWCRPDCPGTLWRPGCPPTHRDDANSASWMLGLRHTPCLAFSSFSNSVPLLNQFSSQITLLLRSSTISDH